MADGTRTMTWAEAMQRLNESLQTFAQTFAAASGTIDSEELNDLHRLGYLGDVRPRLGYELLREWRRRRRLMLAAHLLTAIVGSALGAWMGAQP